MEDALMNPAAGFGIETLKFQEWLAMPQKPEYQAQRLEPILLCSSLSGSITRRRH